MGFLQNEFDEFVISSKRAFDDVKRGIHLASLHHIVLISIGVVACVCGLGGQVLVLNWWLQSFPVEYDGWPAGGPLAALMVTTPAVILLYGFVFAIHIWKYRPSFAFAKNPSVWIHGFAGGFMFAINGFLVIYATPHVPEVIQSVLLCSQIVFTFLFAVLLKVNKGKNFCHALVIISVILSIGGIALGSLATKSPPGHYSDVGVWSLIFCLGIASGAGTNVVAAHFLQHCGYDDLADDPEVLAEEEKHWIESHPNLLAATGQDNSNNNNNKTNRVRVGSGHYGDDEDAVEYHQDQEHHENDNPYGAQPKQKSSGLSDTNNNNTLNMSGYDDQRAPLLKKNNGNKNSPHLNNKNVVAGNYSSLSNTDGASMATQHDLPHPTSSSREDLSQNISGIDDAVEVNVNKSNNYNHNNIDNNNNNNNTENTKQKKMTDDGKYERTDMGTGKNVFLFLSSFFMWVCLSLLSPADAAPWFGTNPNNISATFHSLENGVLCVFDSLPESGECKENAIYFMLFSIAFAATNFGQVVISEHAPVLASIVSQIASPMMTIVLIIFPKLSPVPEKANIGMCVVAVILILVGSLMYGFWEQMTNMRQREDQPHPFSTGPSEFDDDDRTTVNGNHHSNRFGSSSVHPNSQQQYHRDDASYGTLEA